MTERVKHIAEQVRQLPPKGRTELLDTALGMIHDPAMEPDQAWETEIERRVAEIESGGTVLHEADDVLAALRARCLA